MCHLCAKVVQEFTQTVVVHTHTYLLGQEGLEASQRRNIHTHHQKHVIAPSRRRIPYPFHPIVPR